MDVGEGWAPPGAGASAPPPPPPPILPPPAAPAALPTLPGGPRPAGGIVPSPVHHGDIVFEAPAADPTTPVVDPDRPALAPVTRAALGPSRNHRRLGARSRLAIGGTVLSMVTTTAASFALLQRRSGWIEVRDGGSITTGRLRELDDLVNLLAWAQLGVFVVAGIAGLVWFRRAYRNLKTMGRNAYTTGWAFWGWIVPIMSLFRPYQMTKELVRESPRHRGNESTGLVGIWWLALLVAEVAGQVLARVPQNDADDIILNDMLRVVVSGVALLAGVTWIAIIRMVTARQDAWFEPEPEPEPGTPLMPADSAGPPAHR